MKLGTSHYAKERCYDCLSSKDADERQSGGHAVLSIVFINGVPDECFGRRCSRCNYTFKGDRVSVKGE